MASIFSQPSLRYSHQVTSVQGQVYLFGGCTETFDVEDKELLKSSVHIFDQSKEMWLTKTASGELPPPLHYGSCTSAGSDIYIHGGRHRTSSSSSSIVSSLYKFDTQSLQWSQLPRGPERYASGMVAYDGKLFVFGGLDGSYCDCNHLHCFEGENVWLLNMRSS